MAGLYIHIPFCKQACHYCDFHFSTSLKKKEEMVQALIREMELRKAEFTDKAVQTIYFGGGTPSLLEVSDLEQLINTIYTHYQVASNPEVTLEANPDDLSKNRIRELFKTQVNRLSIGIQSFFEEDLRLMNRAHSALEATKAIEEAMRFFDNVSVDLIYGIPGMSNERWQINIQKALSYKVPHISSYALTVEPKTALKKFIDTGLIPDVDDEQAEGQFHILAEVLEQEGFIHYEVSNFGKRGFFSKNNTAYWQGKSYMGIGPSAHSFDGNRRAWNVRNNSKYIRALQNRELPMEYEELSVKDRYNEYVMTGLRTIWGVSLERVNQEFGEIYRKYLLQQSKKYLDRHLLFLDGDILLATKKGKFLVDGMASDLFMLNLA